MKHFQLTAISQFVCDRVWLPDLDPGRSMDRRSAVQIESIFREIGRPDDSSETQL